MNRADLMEIVSGQVGVSKAASDRLLGAVIEAIQSALARGEVVTLEGFGTFSARRLAALTGGNPHAGEPVGRAAAIVPRFTADARCKAAQQSTAMGPKVGEAGDSLGRQDDASLLSHQIAQALGVVNAGYPRMAREIGSFWGFPECRDYLDRVAVDGWDDRSRESIGFNAEVRCAIRTLQSIHVVSPAGLREAAPC
jgi:DNA-binding protein HU-beta